MEFPSTVLRSDETRQQLQEIKAPPAHTNAIYIYIYRKCLISYNLHKRERGRERKA